MALAFRDTSVWIVDPQRHVLFDMPLAHANGLRIDRPKGFFETELPDGFVLSQISAPDHPMEISLQALDEKPGAYGASERPLSWIAGRATYVIRRRNTAELGDHYQLMAFRRERKSWLLLTATVKSSWQEPQFDIAWAILDQAQMTDPDPLPEEVDLSTWSTLWTPEICMPRRPWRDQNVTEDGQHSIKPTYIDPRC